MVICLERGADLHMAHRMPLTVSFFSKIQIVLPFWYWLTWVVPDKGPLNVCVCSSCVCDKHFIAVCVVTCCRMGLLERMPILDKTINTPALANGDSQAGLEDEESLPYSNNVGSRVTPTTSPTSQVLLLFNVPVHCTILFFACNVFFI